MTIKINVLIAFTLILGFSSCDDKPQPDGDIIVPPPIKGSVWVVNEGNFQSGNSSLTVLDVGENKLYQNLFEKVNGRKLGDVFQSVNIINGKAYLMVNNSQKIEVVNASTYKSISTISGFASPRYLLAIDNTKAYVSEYFGNGVKILDLGSNMIVGSIPMAGSLEEMVLVKNKAYVTDSQGKFVYVIDVNTNKVIDSVRVVKSSNSIQVDSAQNVWVLSNGDATTTVLPALQRINTDVDTIDKVFSLGMSESIVSRLRINRKGTTLYWLSKHVYAYRITDAAVSTIPLIRALDQNYYGLGINPYDNEIYVSDAKGFVEQSVVQRFSSNGTYRGEFKGGLITGDFYFYYP